VTDLDVVAADVDDEDAHVVSSRPTDAQRRDRA
jgi:hypothetical protein